MAEKGTYGALQQVKPITTDFGQIAKQEEDRFFAEKERQRKIREEEQAKRAKIAEDFRTDYTTLTDVITGTQSIDEAFARGVGGARDMIGQIYKDIEANPRLADDVGTQLKLANLTNFSKRLKAVSDNYTAYAQTVTKAAQDGSISDWNNETLNKLDSIFAQSNLEVAVDPKTGHPIATTVKVDNDGNVVLGEDGEPVVELVDLQGILDGRGLEEVIPVYEMEDQAQKIGKDLGDKFINASKGGFVDEKKQSFENIEGQARDLISGFLGTPNNPTAVAKSIWADKLGGEHKQLTEEDFTAIEDKFLSAVKPFYDEYVSTTIDYAARTRASKVAQDAKKDSGLIGDFDVVTDQDGNIQKEMFEGVEGDLRGMAVGFSLPVDSKTKQAQVETMNKKGQDIIVDRVFLLDSGELAYTGFVNLGKATGEELDPEKEGKVSRQLRGARVGGGADKNDPVLTAIAKAYGMSNEGQLKKKLQQKVSDFEGSQGSKKEDLRKKYNY